MTATIVEALTDGFGSITDDHVAIRLVGFRGSSSPLPGQERSAKHRLDISRYRTFNIGDLRTQYSQVPVICGFASSPLRQTLNYGHSNAAQASHHSSADMDILLPGNIAPVERRQTFVNCKTLLRVFQCLVATATQFSQR